jgi:YggT family protein
LPDPAAFLYSGRNTPRADRRLTDFLIMILQIVQILLNVFWWIIIVQAILSWLIAFNVINTHNEFVRSIWQALNVMTEPIYRPIRRILPDFGALDCRRWWCCVILLIISG